MTNPKIRKSTRKSKAVLNVQHQQNDGGTGLLNMLHDSGDGVELNLDDYSFDATSDTEDVEEEEDEANSCSSFSLQECINEFRARRIRRLSTQSREIVQTEELSGAFGTDKCEKKALPVPAEADLINQNRTNKEQERKCKPCRDGFCYCFTSDSGEGGSVCAAAVAAASTRAGNLRHVRRHRRSESHELDALMPQLNANSANDRDVRRDSVPINFKVAAEQEPQTLPQKQDKLKRNSTTEATTNGNELTAISRLETSSSDAPLIHIIQELHNNCVISEVRVNKQKLQASRRENSQNMKVRETTKLSPQKVTQTHNKCSDMHEPSAPPLESGAMVQKHPSSKKQAFVGSVLDKISELDSLSDAFAYSTPLTNSSSKHTDSGRRRHKSGGRLLQKRLSLSSVHSKPRRSLLQAPPPKPPRSYFCLEERSIVSSSSSTSPSLREAERILDEFLARKGAIVRERTERKAIKSVEKMDKASQVDMEKMAYAMERRREHRKSCPTSLNDAKLRRQPQLPSCPSLSDLERSALDSNKKYTNYEKNIRRIPEKPIKELSFGWKEPKISEMLNCDTSSKVRQFKSRAVQAEPQQIIGWQVPPKVDLDTVDGVCSNLAANIATKNTPVKAPPIATPKKIGESQKFIWSEQWRNLSPWCNKKSKGGDRTVKSNLKSSSRSLLRSSKKKILRLVTPKRDNLQRRRNYSSHSIGVQTSQDELQPSYEPSGTPQSPPGSYHSAVQTSTQATTTPTSQNTNDTEVQNFDFSRTVHPPPKKASRVSTQRKLNFPLGGCVEASCTSCEHGELSSNMKTKTYRSYHGDLDQDVTLSKLGYILGNIRAKLEASDEHAIRTFQEIERREQLAAGFDCTDGQSRHPKKHSHHAPAQYHTHQRSFYQSEPIYSEIEEDSIHIKGAPQFDNNTTSAKEMPAAKADIEVLYARVNKANKKPKSQPPLTLSTTTTTNPIALGKVLHDSLRNLNSTPYPTQLPTLQELSGSDTSYMSPPQPNAQITDTSMTLSHCQSLNNVRVQEEHSPPKRDRNLNKSDLSLHRSEIFLDNLCRSELLAEHNESNRAVKTNNNDLNKSCSSLRTDSVSQLNTYRHFSTSTPTPNDSISYDTPNDADFDNISQAAISQLGLSLASDSMTSGVQQSTPPKKRNAPKFTTKSLLSTQQSSNLNLSADNALTSPRSRRQPTKSSSCPATPQKILTNYGTQQVPHTSSLREMHGETNHAEQPKYTQSQQQQQQQQQQQLHSTPNSSVSDELQQMPERAQSCIETPTTKNNFARYQRLKDALRKSFKCSKNFVRNETQRLSSSFNFPSTHIGLLKNKNKNNALNQTTPQLHTASSTYDLDALFALDEQAPVVEQLAQAVTICRQLPEVEISPEMVEAERLLLFSRLRRDTWPQRRENLPMRVAVTEYTQRFYVDSMRLPIKMDVNQDFLFNYFYIVTFECGGVIKSTQSAECHNGQAIFSECGIEFVGGLLQDNPEVRCEVFMLRLRKVSTLSLEPRRPIVKLPTIRTPGTASSSSSGDEIVSRFRLHASFTLTALNFIPYEYVECESQNSTKLCLRASSKNCILPLKPRTKSTNLANEIQLCGRVELRFPKQNRSGFLNVQDPHTQHNWNRRWCSLDGIHLSVWSDENQMDDKLLLTLDMRTNVQSMPLQMAPRELCARARAFCLQCKLEKAGEEVDTAAVFFAADTQEELDIWLEQLNVVLQFVDKWLCAAKQKDEVLI